MRQSIIVLASILVAGLAGHVPMAAATTSSELLKCQKTIEKGVRSLASQTLVQVTNCSTKVVNCKLSGEIDGEDTGECLAKATAGCSKAPDKVYSALGKNRDKAIAACGLIPFDELKAYIAGLGFFNVAAGCTPAAGNVNDLMQCVFNDARCNAESQVFLLDPRAQDAVTTANIQISFPCVAP